MSVCLVFEWLRKMWLHLPKIVDFGQNLFCAIKHVTDIEFFRYFLGCFNTTRGIILGYNHQIWSRVSKVRKSVGHPSHNALIMLNDLYNFSFRGFPPLQIFFFEIFFSNFFLRPKIHQKFGCGENFEFWMCPTKNSMSP